MSDFGQIEIYNKYFQNVDKNTIKNKAYDCIKEGKSYYAMYNNVALPIMIGSNLDDSTCNQLLRLKGYFIIDGICKTINNIKHYYRIGITKNSVILTDGSKIEITDMFTIKINNKKWLLPINWKEICINNNAVFEHLSIIDKINKNKYGPFIKEKIDLINICYMFECWLGIKEEPYRLWRLVTAGEILNDCIENKESPIECFKLNKWTFKNKNNVTTISENMKHYNYISDIESIRRVTLASNRELATIKNRKVNIEDSYKICPVQTSDGAICGTVNYLAKNVKILTETKNIDNIENGNDYHLFFNGVYKGMTTESFIKNMVDCEKYFYYDIAYIYSCIGTILPSDCIVSHTASLIPYRHHNPPIRAMFACSMIKQVIMYDYRNIWKFIDNTKTLINDISFKLNVAIMPWYGYNIEDSVIISKSVAERYKYRKTRIYRANNCLIIGKYVNMGDRVYKGQALFKKFDDKKIKTVEIIYSEDEGEIDAIFMKDDAIMIRIIKISILQVGDKMSNFHGQKGVISLILNDNEMPTTENGDKIELLINPHAFPSRMTMGQIKEMGNKLQIVYINNKKLENEILVGKCEYFALRHQVDDKIQYRNKGKYDIINKQPAEGKKNNGGLRFGQMERDILIALGKWDIIKEIWSIDQTTIRWNSKTGKFNMEGCNEIRKVSQSFIICLSVIRAKGYDILLKDNKYSIISLDNNEIKETNTLKFGDIDPSDIRRIKDIVILPICLRTQNLSYLYGKINRTSTKKMIELKINIDKELSILLKSKKGVWRKYVDGHRVDKCIRSVIVPDPLLKIDEVSIPLGANIGTNYGLLNRQPSLNVDSLKLVKLKYGKNKTIGINPQLCGSFNADFDGDEMNIYGIEKEDKLTEIVPIPTQDYILGDLQYVTEKGLTADEKGVKLMIDKKSKGKEFNYSQIYEKIGMIKIDEIYYEIEGCYNNGISEDEWYIMSMLTRNNIASIAINTPVAGQLQSLCIQKII